LCDLLPSLKHPSGRFPFHPPELTLQLSAGRAAAQVSRASLRAGPALGPHLRAMINMSLLYKYFTTHITCRIFEKIGIGSSCFLKEKRFGGLA
ncbi:MAG: hypothetical protein J7L30_01355, partial [Methanophagales archaeon]|nr:hypothetical protein [Methanophagales archaeon]